MADLVTIPNVEVLEVGEDWETSTGVFTFTEDDLQAAVDAQEDPAIRTPVIKFGHTDPRFDGQFSVGRLLNLRTTNNGQTLVGDYVGVPEWLAEILPSAYPRRSIEGMWDYETRTGNRWPFYLTAVALLGEQYPAIDTLEDIEAFWNGDPEWWSPEDVDEDDTVEATQGGLVRATRKADDMPRWRNRKKKGNVEAATQVEDVRRAFYDDPELERTLGLWSWIRAVRIDPADIIVDDDNGGLWRIPYTAGDAGVTFDDPVQVEVVYEDVAAVAASEGGRPEVAATYATRDDSRSGMVSATDRSDPTEGTVPLTATQLEELGLEEDATADDVVTRLGELGELAEAGFEPAATTDDTDDGDDAGDDTTDDADDGDEIEVPDGMALVDASALSELQANARRGASAADTLEQRERDEYLDGAIRAGKFRPADRQRYEDLMREAPKATRKLIDNMAENVVPVESKGGNGSDATDTGAGDTDDAYPASWLPEVAARKQSA